MSLRPTRPSNYQEKHNFPKREFNLKRVYDIILSPNHPFYTSPDSIGVIFFGDLQREEVPLDPSTLSKAKPIDLNNFQYPLIGEIVEVISSVTGDNYYADMGGDPKNITNYYKPSINVHSNVASNSLPYLVNSNVKSNVENYKFNNLQKSGSSIRYETEFNGATRELARKNLDNYLYSIGFISGKDNPNAPRYDLFQRPNGDYVYRLIDGSIPENTKLGNYFVEKSDLKPLLPMEGDSIYQGRNGQSIRFSTTTPNNINPWSSGVTDKVDDNNPTIGDPVILLRTTGPSEENSESILEDINNDAASIYLFSKQGLKDFVPSSTNISSLKSEYTPVASPLTTISQLPTPIIQTPTEPPTTSNVEFTSSINNIEEPIVIEDSEPVYSEDPVFDALDEAADEELLSYEELTYEDSDYDVIFDDSPTGAVVIPPSPDTTPPNNTSVTSFNLNNKQITDISRNTLIRPTKAGYISQALGAVPYNNNSYRGWNEFGGYRGGYPNNQNNRKKNRVGKPRWHYGVDISPKGNKTSDYLHLLAIGDGIIFYYNDFNCSDGKKDSCGGGYGNSICIKLNKHPNYIIHYAHCKPNSIQNNPRTSKKWKVGDSVKQGEFLAVMGDSGGSYGTHLHFEIIFNPNAKLGNRNCLGDSTQKKDPQSVYTEFTKGYKYTNF
jgi:murein DD-endopeptidase MepM/ murein hydrolase activator NlpD